MSLILNILGAIVFTLIIYAFVLFHWKRRHLYRMSYNLPGRLALPIIGNGFSFLCEPEQIMDRILSLIRPYKSPGRFWLGPKLYITTHDAEHARILLSSSKIISKDDAYQFANDYVGQGLITGSGETWKLHRKIIQPTLNNHILTSYLEIFGQQTDILVEKMASEVGKPAFNLINYSHLCTVDIGMETLIDVKVHAQNNNNVEICHWLERTYTLIHERICKVWLHPDFIFYKTARGHEQIQAVKAVRGFISDAISKKREMMESNLKNKTLGLVSEKLVRKCTAEHLLEMMMKDSTVMTHEALIDEISTLVFAGEDTTSTIYSFTMMMLGMYSKYQDKVVEEYEAILGSSKQYSILILSKLKYLEMCIKESIRLLPIAPFILRKVTEEIQLGPYSLPVGANVILSIYSLHHNKEHWEHPHEFHPDHFLPEVIEKRHPYAWTPFSMGPRNCLGKAYAMMVLKIMIVNTLRRFRVEADGKPRDLIIYSDISCRVKGGCMVRIFDRN